MSASPWLRPTQQRKSPVRPRLEMLEDRITPTVFAPTTFSDGVSAGGAVNTLRDAVIAANSDTGTAADTIQLSAGTYSLTLPNLTGIVGVLHETQSQQGDLNITSTAHALLIQGATDANGNPTSVIQQTVADRVFQIVNPGTSVTFKNVVIEGGNAQENGGNGTQLGTTNAQGGGILDDGGNVALSNVVVQSNQASAGTGSLFGQGGGIFVQDGTLTISHSVIQNNKATGGLDNGSNGGDADGGGICLVTVTGTPQLTITKSAVVNNVAQGGAGAAGGSGTGGDAHGGGIYGNASSNTITGCTLAGNKSIGGKSTTGQPDGNGSGGGAELSGSNTIVNSTIAVNSTTGGSAAGGGVYFAAGASGSLTNITVVGNSATLSGATGNAEGGGLDNNNGDVQDVTLTNSVVAGNTVATSAGSPQSPDVRGQIVSGGHNFIGIADGVNDPGFTAPGDKAGSAATPLLAKLGALQSNGGPTQTILPLAGSPLLGGGDPSKAPATDQRGAARPAGGPTDIGAVQVSGVSTAPSPSPSPSGSSNSPPPSLFQAIIGLYIAEFEKDLGFGNPTALQNTIDFNSQYTVIFGFNIAPLIVGLADANAQSALGGVNRI